MTPFHEPVHAYALTHQDATVLMDSASGGAFTALATPILRAGGVVYAARLYDDGTVRHEAITSEEQLHNFRGSVYAQSDTRAAFERCAEAVRSGRRALFVGTPCQAAALVGFLRTERVTDDLESCANLVLCDLICHGVPNQELLKAYFQWLSDRNRTDGGIHDYKFRSKKRGWGLYYNYSFFRRGKRHEVLDSAANDPYFRAFNAGLTFRESCYSCPFARIARVSDVTIGDFWGVEEVLPATMNPNGVSLVLTNTEKGERYFSGECASACSLMEVDPHTAARYNHNLNSPSERPATRSALMEAMAEKLARGRLRDVFDEEMRVPMTLKRLAKGVLPEGILKRLRGRGC
jgi:coenzyme F420-reducing hydrogenase beta subunit